MEDKFAKDRHGKLNWNVNMKEIIKWKFYVGEALISVMFDTDSDVEELAWFRHIKWNIEYFSTGINIYYFSHILFTLKHSHKMFYQIK